MRAILRSSAIPLCPNPLRLPDARIVGGPRLVLAPKASQHLAKAAPGVALVLMSVLLENTHSIDLDFCVCGIP
jgi:hypothetical protein